MSWRRALAAGLLLGASQATPAAAPADEVAPAPASEPLPLLGGPELIAFSEATYPPEAAALGVEADVLLLIEIDPTGAVTAVSVLVEPAVAASDGPARTWGFGPSAVEAARRFRFSPAFDATGPVPVAVEFNYRFVLSDAAPAAAELAPTKAGPVQVEGQLLEMGTRRPLNGFPLVVQTADGARAEVATDDDGRFALSGLPVGPAVLSSTYPGYGRVEQKVEVPADGAVGGLRLWLRNLSYRDDEIIGVYRLPTADVTRRTLTTDEIRKVPGTFGDAVRVIQNLPGAARAPLGTGLLVIRGANPEDSGVYVDGIRIPFIYHLGGYVSVINSDLIERVDYLPGGYGVQYGRTLGGVIDVATRSEFPERHTVNWSTDLLDSGGMVAGRMGSDDQVGYAVAARRSYIDLFIPGFQRLAGGDPDFVVKPRWYDYQVKVEKLNLDQGRLGVFVFGFQDLLQASTPDSFAQGTDQDTQGDLGTIYDTHRLIVHFERPLGDQLELRILPSLGLDTAAFNLGDALSVRNWQLLAELRAELAWTPAPGFKLIPGVDFIGGMYGFEVELPFNPDSFASYDPLEEREPWTQEGTGTVWAPDLYVQAQLRPLADRDRLLVVPGARLNLTQITGQYDIMSVDPRLTARFKLSKTSTLKGGTGIYHQPPQPFESYRPGGGVVIDYERSWASELGIEQQLGRAFEADATAFYKRLDGLIVGNPEFDSLDDQFNVNEGAGRIAGVEAIVKLQPVGQAFGWLSYTLSKSMRNDYPEANGADLSLWPSFEADEGWYRFDFDQTHIFVLVGGYKLPRDWELSAKYQHVTGNPYTPYEGGIYDVDQDFYNGYTSGDYNSARMPAFAALDLRVDKLFTFKRWQLNLYLDLLNLYRGENPEFVVYNYDYTESAFIRGLPFIPSPGFAVEVEF